MFEITIEILGKVRKIYFGTAIRNALVEAPPIGFTSETKNLRIVERSKGTKREAEENFINPVDLRLLGISMDKKLVTQLSNATLKLIEEYFRFMSQSLFLPRPDFTVVIRYLF